MGLSSVPQLSCLPCCQEILNLPRMVPGSLLQQLLNHHHRPAQPQDDQNPRGLACSWVGAHVGWVVPAAELGTGLHRPQEVRGVLTPFQVPQFQTSVL